MPSTGIIAATMSSRDQAGDMPISATARLPPVIA
jgi:hypothetical protein